MKGHLYLFSPILNIFFHRKKIQTSTVCFCQHAVDRTGAQSLDLWWEGHFPPCCPGYPPRAVWQHCALPPVLASPWVIWPHKNVYRFLHSDHDNSITQAEAKAALLLPSWLAKRDDSGMGGEDSKLKTSATHTFCYRHKHQGAVDLGSDIANIKSKEQSLGLLTTATASLCGLSLMTYSQPTNSVAVGWVGLAFCFSRCLKARPKLKQQKYWQTSELYCHFSA